MPHSLGGPTLSSKSAAPLKRRPDPTEDVWRCAQGHGLADRAPPAQGAKQSGGKFPSADKTTGADYEAVQIAATGPEIPVHS
jgi:hypothetical protein